MSDAIQDIIAERKRQIESEGWTPEHDDEHSKGELSRAAACYALGVRLHEAWPWERCWWKPGGARRNLVKAGALIIAEIERLDRRSSAAPPDKPPIPRDPPGPVPVRVA